MRMGSETCRMCELQTEGFLRMGKRHDWLKYKVIRIETVNIIYEQILKMATNQTQRRKGL